VLGVTRTLTAQNSFHGFGPSSHGAPVKVVHHSLKSTSPEGLGAAPAPAVAPHTTAPRTARVAAVAAFPTAGL